MVKWLPNRRQRVAILFPGNYALNGGMARTAIQLCRYLLDLTPAKSGAYDVVLGANLANGGERRFAQLSGQPRFQLVDLQWTVAAEVNGIKYIRPYSLAGFDYLSCDAWILFGCPGGGAVAHLRPFAVFCADWVVHVVPHAAEYFPHARNPIWEDIAYMIESCRQADVVFSTTPRTLEDDIAFAGVPRSKTRLAPLFSIEDFSRLPTSPEELPFSRYFMWTTNDTAHKNHKRALDALDLYYNKYSGSLPVVITGYASEYFDPKRGINLNAGYTQPLQDRIARSPQLLANLYFPGPLPVEKYAFILKGACFLWHNVIYDNGTASCFEAAQLGVPSLSADYPQMRYFTELFGTNTRFFSAFDIEASAAALKSMETATAAGLRACSDSPVDDQGRVKAFFAELIDDLLQSDKLAGDTTSSPARPLTRRQRAAAILRLHLREAPPLAAPRAPVIRNYLDDFPFESVPCLLVSVDDAVSEAALQRLVAALTSLLRERFCSFKVLLDVTRLGQALLARLNDWIDSLVLHHDVVLIGEAPPVVWTSLHLLADLRILLHAAASATDAAQLQEDSLRCGVPVVSISDNGGELRASGIDGLAGQCWGDSLVDDLIIALSERGRLLNRQRLAQAVVDRQDYADLFSVAEPQLHRQPLRLPDDLRPVPAVPRLIDLRSADGHPYLTDGFYPKDGDDAKLRWARKEASLVLGRWSKRLVLNALVESEVANAGISNPELTLAINGQVIGSVKLQIGEHHYKIQCATVDTRTKISNKINISANYDYKAGGPASSDQRRIAWGLISIGFADS